MTAPEIRLVLTVGFDPRGYFLVGLKLFKLANEKLFGLIYSSVLYRSLASLWQESLCASAAALLHIDCAISLSIL